MYFHLKKRNLIGMKLINAAFGAICITFYTLTSFGQCAVDSSYFGKKPYEWDSLADGLLYCVVDAPQKSILGDSKITIVRITPSKMDFSLVTATEYGRARSVCEWADTFDFNVVLNAGMYELSNGLINRGFMKNYGHHNNALLRENYNSMIALNAKDSSDHNFCIIDLQCDPWHTVKDDYHCYAQGLRMIDCNGTAMGWNKRYQSCSMMVAATDARGNIYYIYSRSPYTHNEMIRFMVGMPYGLTNAIYIEGGPETSLYIRTGDRVVEKVGSYVSQTYPNDNNMSFWALPNVIGMRLKK
jgi:hypothetical protein